MRLGANGWVGLVVVSLTALLAGCGALTATPTPNQPTVDTSGSAPSSRSIRTGDTGGDGVEPARRHP